MLWLKRGNWFVQRFSLLLEFFVLLSTLQVGLRAQEVGLASPAVGSHPKALSDSTRRVVFDNGAFTGASTAVPNWENGYLASREIETFQAGVPNVRLYNQSGKLV